MKERNLKYKGGGRQTKKKEPRILKKKKSLSFLLFSVVHKEEYLGPCRHVIHRGGDDLVTYTWQTPGGHMGDAVEVCIRYAYPDW